MTRKFLLSTALIALSAFAADPTPTVHASKLMNANGGTDCVITFNSANPQVTAFVVNISIDNGGQSESLTRIVQRSQMPGFPSQFIQTYATFSVSSDPGKVKINRIKVTPVKEFQSESVTITP